MKISLLTLAAFMLITPGLPAAEPASAARESLIAAERAFAARAAATSNRTAFLEVLTDDSVVFHPDAVNGKTWWTARPERKAKLLWAPDFVVVASNGELGLSNGPWIFLDEKGVEVAAGRFTSIWKRDGDGPWKLALDHGIGYPRATGTPWMSTDFATITITNLTITDYFPMAEPTHGEKSETAPIHRIDPKKPDPATIVPCYTHKSNPTRFERSDCPLDQGLGAEALDRVLTRENWLSALKQNTRVQRDGEVPGGDPRWIAARSRAARWVPVGGGASKDGALAYSYGDYTLTPARPGDPDEHGIYIHVWSGGKLILEQFNPADAK